MSCVCVARQGNNFAVTIAPEPPCIGLRRHKRRLQRREAGFCRGHGRYGWHSLPELSGDFPQAICMWKTARFLHPRRDQGRSFPCVSSNPFHQCSGRDGKGRGGEWRGGAGRERWGVWAGAKGRREKGEGSVFGQLSLGQGGGTWKRNLEYDREYAVRGRAWSAIDEKLGDGRRTTVRVGRTKRRVLCIPHGGPGVVRTRSAIARDFG